MQRVAGSFLNDCRAAQGAATRQPMCHCPARPAGVRTMLQALPNDRPAQVTVPGRSATRIVSAVWVPSPACPPARLPAGQIPMRLWACLPACLATCLPGTCLLICMLACMPSCMHACRCLHAQSLHLRKQLAMALAFCMLCSPSACLSSCFLLSAPSTHVPALSAGRSAR